MIPSALVEKKTITPFFYAQGFTASGIQYPANILELWTPKELIAVGVYPLILAPVALPYYIAGTPTYALVLGKVVESRTDTPMPLADAKVQKQSEIDMDFEVAIQQILAGYPQAERESWTLQEAEADSYPTKPTPFLDGLALARGVPIATLVTRIKTNSAMFKASSSALIGAKQKRSDMLAVATTLTDVINV